MQPRQLDWQGYDSTICGTGRLQGWPNQPRSEQTIMAIAGHVSCRMQEHYSLEWKRSGQPLRPSLSPVSVGSGATELVLFLDSEKERVPKRLI
jgi:hypothetical protein